MKNELKAATNKDLRIIGHIIEDAQICMLTTYNLSGGLCSRPMYALELDANGNLWFFTSTTSHLISELRSNHNVQITFASGKNKFVSASAKAYEVFDRAHMQSLWTPMMKTWFPQGLESTDLVLLRLELEDIEYWEEPTSPVTRITGFFKSMITNQPAQGHHEKINMHH